MGAALAFSAFHSHRGWHSIQLGRDRMRTVGWLGLFLVLASCATTRPAEPDFCQPQISFTKGKQDAQAGIPASAAFTRLCSPKSSPLALLRYREGYEQARLAKRQKSLANLELLSREVEPLPEPTTWVCEVEAAAKVFTGVGGSLEEATRSAKDTCGAHFQSSSCTQTECKQSL